MSKRLDAKIKCWLLFGFEPRTWAAAIINTIVIDEMSLPEISETDFWQ